MIGVFSIMSSCGDENGSARNDSDTVNLLPDAPSQWRQSGETRIFGGLALSDYINGGSEAYYAYGFREVAAQDFEDDSGARLTVEIYEMDRPENAFGIYSTDSAGERWQIGADASYGSGLLRFWKGRFFVRILCYPPDEEIEKIIRETGKKIADAIQDESARPDMFLSFVPEGADPDSVCYFHRQTSLNNIRFISDENLLRLGDEVDAITWEERVPAEVEARLRLIVLRYPSNADAESAYDNFSRQYLKVTPGVESKTVSPEAVQQSNDKYATATVSAPWLVVVLDAPSADAAASAARRTLGMLDSQNQSEESS